MKFQDSSFPTLPKHAHAIYRCKNDNFQMKKVDSFLIFAQNIDYLKKNKSGV